VEEALSASRVMRLEGLRVAVGETAALLQSSQLLNTLRDLSISHLAASSCLPMAGSTEKKDSSFKTEQLFENHVPYFGFSDQRPSPAILFFTTGEAAHWQLNRV
jgi:hypothetical protein